MKVEEKTVNVERIEEGNDFVEEMILKKGINPEIIEQAKAFASGNVLYGKYPPMERWMIAKHNFLYGALVMFEILSQKKNISGTKELNNQ